MEDKRKTYQGVAGDLEDKKMTGGTGCRYSYQRLSSQPENSGDGEEGPNTRQSPNLTSVTRS